MNNRTRSWRKTAGRAQLLTIGLTIFGMAGCRATPVPVRQVENAGQVLAGQFRSLRDSVMQIPAWTPPLSGRRARQTSATFSDHGNTSQVQPGVYQEEITGDSTVDWPEQEFPRPNEMPAELPDPVPSRALSEPLGERVPPPSEHSEWPAPANIPATSFHGREMSASLPPTATERVIQLTGENRLLLNDKQTLQATVDRLLEENRQLLEVKTGLESELAQVSAELDRASGENRQLTAQLELLNRRIREFNTRRQTQVAELNQMIGQLERQLQQSKTPASALSPTAPTDTATPIPGQDAGAQPDPES